MDEKFYPAPGDKLNLCSVYGGTSVPCTVVGMRNSQVLVVRECRMTFPQPRHYDTLPDRIEPGRPGTEKTYELRWAPKGGCWKEPGTYGRRARFGEWVFEPYLD